MRADEAKRVCECRFMGLEAEGVAPGNNPNVMGVGLGRKVVHGHGTPEMSIKFYVRQKLHRLLVREEQRIPPEIEGVPTDVEESGPFLIWRPLPPVYHRKVRPAMGGLSIGHYAVSTGTFGCLVKGRTDTYILSNNHVLANENRGAEGDPVLQPGRFDGGKTDRDVIARLDTYVALDPEGLNLVDCALAGPYDVGDVTADILNVGRLKGSRPPELAERVRKSGRTTRLTQGQIVDENATIRVGYSGGSFIFQDQMIIRGEHGRFSGGGDSGAVIVGEDDRALGLLFGGSPFFTVANKMTNVEGALDVRVV